MPHDTYIYSSAFTECLHPHPVHPVHSPGDRCVQLVCRAPQLRSGHRLVLTGSDRILGEWNPQQGIPMTEHGYNEWVAEIAADLLTDIVFHSTFPQREIDKEVDVICDEIESFKDSPSELIFDEFEQRLFAGSPLGRDILGTARRLKTYTTADALRFTRQHYRPENAVFFLSGDIEGKKAARTLKRLFEKFPIPEPEPDEKAFAAAPSEQISAPVAHCFDVSVNKDTHQAHVMIGTPTFGGSDGRRFALLLLNNMLGGPGMSSRLNIALRERAALVYSVDSYISTYPDAGYWHVYFGCDGADVPRCCRLVRRELRRLAETPLTPARLAAAKAQMCGQIGIAQDNGESRALALGRTYAEYGTVRDVALLRRNIEAVTA